MAPSASSNASRIADDVVPVADRSDRLDVDEFQELFDEEKNNLESWKAEHAPYLPVKSFPETLWYEADTLRLCGEYGKLESDVAVAGEMLKEVETAFKGNLKTNEKKVLKREFLALKFGHYHATKRFKFGESLYDQYGKMMENGHLSLLKELKLLSSDNKKLKHENQSLCTSHHHSLISIQSKDEDLQVQALFRMATQFCKKQKIGAAIFVNFGFAISKSLLSSEVKCIKKANDFGPNCATGGRQFFKSLFKELSKGAADSKCKELTDIKDHELMYNNTINCNVANDPLTHLTGHALDTKTNRTLLWYGSPKFGSVGVASLIIKAFNGKRSDEASKKICPIIGMFNSECDMVASFPCFLNLCLLCFRIDVASWN